MFSKPRTTKISKNIRLPAVGSTSQISAAMAPFPNSEYPVCVSFLCKGHTKQERIKNHSRYFYDLTKGFSIWKRAGIDFTPAASEEIFEFLREGITIEKISNGHTYDETTFMKNVRKLVNGCTLGEFNESDKVTEEEDPLDFLFDPMVHKKATTVERLHDNISGMVRYIPLLYIENMLASKYGKTNSYLPDDVYYNRERNRNYPSGVQKAIGNSSLNIYHDYLTENTPEKAISFIEVDVSSPIFSCVKKDIGMTYYVTPYGLMLFIQRLESCDFGIMANAIQKKVRVFSAKPKRTITGTIISVTSFDISSINGQSVDVFDCEDV